MQRRAWACGLGLGLGLGLAAATVGVLGPNPSCGATPKNVFIEFSSGIAALCSDSARASKDSSLVVDLRDAEFTCARVGEARLPYSPCMGIAVCCVVVPWKPRRGPHLNMHPVQCFALNMRSIWVWALGWRTTFERTWDCACDCHLEGAHRRARVFRCVCVSGGEHRTLYCRPRSGNLGFGRNAPSAFFA